MTTENPLHDLTVRVRSQTETISELTEALKENTERLRRANIECIEQHCARVAAESELSSVRFAHWVAHVVLALMIAWLLLCLSRGTTP